MKSKNWITGFIVLTLIPLLFIAVWVIKIDPFFHYHKPDVSSYYFNLNNERSQNDGILRNFDYQGIITGTSMTQNFKTSEAEDIFGCEFVLVPYSGGTYKEINDSLKHALKYNSDIEIVIRGLDMMKFYDDKDEMRTDLGDFPVYLYNDSPFDDVQYVFNRDVVTTVYGMVAYRDNDGFMPGIRPFDEAYNWMSASTFGVNTVLHNGIKPTDLTIVQTELSDEEKQTIVMNVRQNITSLAEEYPDVTFYYFLTPYSAAWWQDEINAGRFNRQIQAERIVIEEIIKTPNIKLFSFNNMIDITSDLNNYKDTIHYADWINSLILVYMNDGVGLITNENYEKYLQEESVLYWNFDYETCFKTQEDYSFDYYAAALLNNQINNVEPLDLNDYVLVNAEIKNAEIIENQYDSNFGVLCHGTLNRSSRSEIEVVDYFLEYKDYDGFMISVDDISEYNYLVFYGKKVAGNGQPTVYVYDDKGNFASGISYFYGDINDGWNLYLVDVSSVKGKADIIFHGGYIDDTGNADSAFVFSCFSLF